MNLPGLLFILLAQFFTGKGVVRLFRIDLKPIATLCFSMLCGVVMASFVPCFMQLAHVPITAHNTYIGLSVMTALFSIPLLINIRNTKMPKVTFPELYEVPFILVFLGLAITSVWRCYYLPVTPRDMLTGPELIAEFAVREKTMISSIFNIDLRLAQPGANNIFKSPFITGLQIIYKLLVHPFGQQWLSVVFLSFTIWLYTLLRQTIHPLIAGLLLLIFFAVPDLFAYTYLILYDYSNMVFFFAGGYFLARYMENRRLNELFWASFLLGVATYIRTETLLFAVMIAPLMALYLYKKKEPVKAILISSGSVVLVSFIFYFLCTNIFIKHFIPYTFNIKPLINPNLGDVSLFFDKLVDMSSKLMFAKKGEAVYAHFFYIFVGLLVIDIIWPRKFNYEARIALTGIAVTYIGLALLGYLIPSNSLENTTKRGLFKILPFMVWYMANSGMLQKLSDFIKRREFAKASGATATVKAAPAKAAIPKPKQTPEAPKPRQGKNKR